MVRPSVLLDTGPLVALLDRGEPHHSWAVGQFENLPFPFVTCEVVIGEAAHLAGKIGITPDVVLDFVRTGAVVIDYQLAVGVEQLQILVQRYADVPMDLADACLVRLAERYSGASVLTLDSDFFVYRTSDGSALPVIHPVSSPG
ncbi:MAG: PIN domain-containing protein [Bacteroidota bacterium]